jgi:hypothetical protein
MATIIVRNSSPNNSVNLDPLLRWVKSMILPSRYRRIGGWLSTIWQRYCTYWSLIAIMIIRGTIIYEAIGSIAERVRLRRHGLREGLALKTKKKSLK